MVSERIEMITRMKKVTLRGFVIMYSVRILSLSMPFMDIVL